MFPHFAQGGRTCVTCTTQVLQCAHRMLCMAVPVHMLLCTQSRCASMSCALQAPSAPNTPYGEMMAYYLKMEPSLFESAVDTQFNKIMEQRDESKTSTTADESAQQPATESTDLVLSGLQSRVQDLAAKERQATVEDLMYMCALHMIRNQHSAAHQCFHRAQIIICQHASM